MHSLSAPVLLLSTLLVNTLALPTSKKPLQGRVTLPLHNSKLARRAQTSVEAGNLDYGEPNAEHWVATVTLGSTQVSLNLDTGSSDLWVYGPSAPNPSGRVVYDPTTSSSGSYSNGESFNIQYADSTNFASGSVATDSVTVGGLTMTGMDIGVADTLGSLTQEQPYDGMIGLAFQGLNSVSPDKSQTFPELMQPYLDSPVFSVNFKEDGSGSLAFGYSDSSLYTGNLMSASVNNGDSSWTVDGVTFDIGPGGFSQSMLFDTGAVNTIVDPSVAAAYWGQVSGAVDNSAAKDGSGWEYPCGAGLPNFDMYFNGQEVTIPGNLIASGQDSNNQGMCVTGLQGGAGRGTMGYPFWLAYYVVFNTADPSVSFAPQA